MAATLWSQARRMRKNEASADLAPSDSMLDPALEATRASPQGGVSETRRFWKAVAERPHAYDLFALLRRVESCAPESPRLGRGKRPSHEPLRIGQEPSSIFAPSTIVRLRGSGTSGVPTLDIYSFGLFGPNGPLPLVFTEHAHDRSIHHGDRTLVEFANIFHHRLALLFYRAWADAQSCVSLDRTEDEIFTRHASSLIGYGLPSLRGRDSIPEHARLHHSGHLVRQTRNAEGLGRILAQFFRTTASIDECVAHWMPIPLGERSRLGASVGVQLGVDAVAGMAVWDRQHRFRIRLGPMRRETYESLLPIGRSHRQLLDWLRTYIGVEADWDVRLALAANDVPTAQLGADTRLGWTTWLHAARVPRNRDDLVLDPERIAGFSKCNP